jgi:hypothetical protein
VSDCGIDHWDSDPAAEIAADLGYWPGRISLLVPSRGRPDRCLAMWQSALGTADDPLSVELVLYLDDDDPTLPAYRQWIRTTDHSRIKDLAGPRIILSETWNRCWDAAGGEIGWHGNDDVRFRWPSWDSAVRRAFAEVPDRILLVHGRDGIHDQAMATLGFLHRRWTDTVGYFVPPYFSSDYNDTWNSEVADRIGRRRFLPEVYTEHLHPAVGKGPMDQTHQERLVRHRQDNVDALFVSLAPERERDAEKLRGAINEFEDPDHR